MLEPATTNFTSLVALFLSEVIRSRKVTVRRAAEVSVLVVEALPNLQSEEQVLIFLTQIEHEFEEVAILKQALCFRRNDSDIEVYEQEIKEYASELFNQDMVASTNFLQDAARDDVTIQKLCIKYPDFCKHLLLSTEKMPLLERLDLAY